MTLSFITRWRDELPATYTALSPTPLNNARLIWHNAELANTLDIPSSLFENGAGVWGGEALLPGMSPLAQVYSGHQFGIWGTGAAFYSANSSLQMAAQWTGICKARG